MSRNLAAALVNYLSFDKEISRQSGLDDGLVEEQFECMEVAQEYLVNALNTGVIGPTSKSLLSDRGLGRKAKEARGGWERLLHLYLQSTEVSSRHCAHVNSEMLNRMYSIDEQIISKRRQSRMFDSRQHCFQSQFSRADPVMAVQLQQSRNRSAMIRANSVMTQAPLSVLTPVREVTATGPQSQSKLMSSELPAPQVPIYAVSNLPAVHDDIQAYSACDKFDDIINDDVIDNEQDIAAAYGDDDDDIDIYYDPSESPPLDQALPVGRSKGSGGGTAGAPSLELVPAWTTGYTSAAVSQSQSEESGSELNTVLTVDQDSVCTVMTDSVMT